MKTTADLGSTTDMSLASAWGENMGGMVSLANVVDKVTTARGSVRRDVDLLVFSGIEAGVLYSHRRKTLDYDQTNYILSDGQPCLNNLSCMAIPPSLRTSTVNMGFVGLPRVLYLDVDTALDSGVFLESPIGRDPAWNWGVNEKVTTGFAKLTIDNDSWIPLKGNIGIQVIHTNQRASGLYVDANGDASPVNGGTSFTDVLPSFNLNAEIGHNSFVRIGAAKALARAEMGDMRAGITAAVSAADRKWYGDGGNPDLKPWQSWDFDVSLEHYIGQSSYVAVAGFYKDITRGIVTKDVAYDFSGYANASQIQPISPIGTLTTPVNTAGGNLYGLEFSTTLEGNLVAGFLDGFGVTGSFSKSWLHAKTDKDGAYLDTLLEGFSGNVWSGSVYYEKNGIQLRVGDRYRSGYSARRHNAFRFVTENIQSEHIVDVQAGYTIQSGPLENLGFLLQANNITNEPYVTSQTAEGRTAPQQYHKFGVEYLFGVSYAF